MYYTTLSGPLATLTEVKVFSHVRLCDPMDYIVHEFSRPEHWSGSPFPSPVNLPDSGIKPRSPALQVDSLLSEPPGKPKEQWSG